MFLLGSASPRRRELFGLLQVPFRIAAPDVNEDRLAGEEPAVYLERIGLAKADALAIEPGDRALLVADTTVIVDGDILGKPASAAEARSMLERLSGRAHQVATRFLIRTLGGVTSEYGQTVYTTVTFRALRVAELEAYASSGEGSDKAGGYAIQGGGAAFVHEIQGSYSNVVGLPVSHVAEALDRLGLR